MPINPDGTLDNAVIEVLDMISRRQNAPAYIAIGKELAMVQDDARYAEYQHEDG